MAVRIAPATQLAVEVLAAEQGVTKSDVVRVATEEALKTENLPPHTCAHFAYALSCDEYDALAQRAGGACEICGTVPPKLHIDHDHSLRGRSARGLVCPKCNAHLRRVDAGERKADEATARYLENAFHKTLPPLPEPPPPPVPGGSVRQRGVSMTDLEWHDVQTLAAAEYETATAFVRRAVAAEIRRAKRRQK